VSSLSVTLPLLRAVDATNPISDAALVVRAREGERWAQGAIYHRHAPRLLNVCARLLGNRADAMDLVQDVFVESLESLRTLRDPSALGSWLLSRAVKKSQRRLLRARWGRLFGLRHASEVSLSLLARPGCSPELLADLERVSLLLERLPARQRIAWLLHVVEGETLSSVALLTGTSLATAKRDLVSARATIDAQLKDRP
jgi:RNA polymerase sigma-70 factor, ECF subfamily